MTEKEQILRDILGRICVRDPHTRRIGLRHDEAAVREYFKLVDSEVQGGGIVEKLNVSERVTLDIVRGE